MTLSLSFLVSVPVPVSLAVSVPFPVSVSVSVSVSVRMNGAVTKGYEEDVGNRTSVYIHTAHAITESPYLFHEYGYNNAPHDEVGYHSPSVVLDHSKMFKGPEQ